MQEEYNEVYGYLPRTVVNHLSEEDKHLAFVSWLMREPTPAGMFITQVVVKALGPQFLEYMFLQIAQTNDLIGIPLTKEAILSGVKDIMDLFSTDTNVLHDYVSYYLEEHEHDQETIKRVQEEMSLKDLGKNPGIMEQFKKTLTKEAEPSVTAPQRDPKTGRFTKRG